MTKKEIAEIKKQFTPRNCSISRICGCYVDGEKNKKTRIKEAFLSLSEDEAFKYFEILRKSLSGSLGKNLLNLDFPLEAEREGGTQEFLYRMRKSQLQDEDLLEEFYDKIIASYEYAGNYLILLIHDLYDIPGKTTDGIVMDDASDEVYEFLLCCICPVALSKPGLSYNDETNTFQNRIRDWVVNMPEIGFLFPAFNDRRTDIHSTLYYAKDGDILHNELVEELLGCRLPLAAGDQKETFHALIEETLGDEIEYEVVRSIHETLNEILEEHKDDPEPVTMDKNQVRTLLAESGVEEDKLEHFDQCFDHTAGETTQLLAANVTNTRTFEVKTPDVVIKVNPEAASLVETKVVDGRPCLVIPIHDHVEVNGVMVKQSHTLNPALESLLQASCTAEDGTKQE